MKKIYMTPNLKVTEIDVTSIIASSLDGDNPASGLGTSRIALTNGGSGDEGDDEFAGAKGSFNWDNEW